MNRQPKRAVIGRWHFSFWPLSHWTFGWRRDRWDAGSFAIDRVVVTYLRKHYAD